MSLKNEIFVMIDRNTNNDSAFAEAPETGVFVTGFEGLISDSVLQIIGIKISEKFNTYVQWRGCDIGFCVVTKNNKVFELLDEIKEYIKTKKNKRQ